MLDIKIMQNISFLNANLIKSRYQVKDRKWISVFDGKDEIDRLIIKIVATFEIAVDTNVIALSIVRSSSSFNDVIMSC